MATTRPCAICGAEVLFVPLAETGKRLIVDAKPLADAVRVVTRDGEPVAEFIDGDAYTAHTCPHAVT